MAAQMLRVSIAALLLSCVMCVAQYQVGDANRDYTINGAGSMAGLTVQTVQTPLTMANAYSCQDAFAPVVWSTSTAVSSAPWYMTANNRINIGPTPLSLLGNGLGGTFFDQFFWTDASGQWNASLWLQQLPTTTYFNMGHFTTSVPDGIYISQVQGLVPGLPLVLTPLNLTNNSSAAVDLSPYQLFFRYYDQAYSTFFVNSNGSVSFGSGNTDFSPTIAEFLGQQPRIALFWNDLDPQGGTVQWTLDQNPTLPLLRVEFAGVTAFLAFPPPSHTFALSAELTPMGMLAGGMLTLEHDVLNDPSPYDTLVGLSPGSNLSSATPIDLSGSASGLPNAALYEQFAGAPGGSGSLYDLVGITKTFVPTSIFPGAVGYNMF